jgi:hypothetical protein
MLHLLLDEHLSADIADGLILRRPEISITSVHRWRNGNLLGCPDDAILLAAAKDGLTVVTYDLKTIRPLLNEWRALGLAHAGVLFVDGRTIRSHDFGGLIRALESLWDRERTAIWTNRIEFLRPC